MTAQVDDFRHPVVASVVGLRASLSSLASAPLWGLTTADTEAALLEVTALATQVAQLQLRLLHHGERVEVGAAVGATSAANWVAHETRTTRPAMQRAARLASSLDAGHAAVDAALAEATINIEQAHVIVAAVDDLPEDVPAETVERAEAFLLAEAADHDAKALRVLGRRLLDVIDPDAGEAEEARRLEAEEADARAAASLTISDDGHGQCHGRFTLPSLHGSMLVKAIQAIAAQQLKRRDTPSGTPTRHQLGLAFMDYIETRTEQSLPTAGGCGATVVVTMDISSLMGGLKAAGLCDGTRISAAEARRLACTAGIIPAVLGGQSEPLDVGRRKRFFTKAQRIALALRDHGCTAQGCDRPPAACDAHHNHPWSRGGTTDLTHGRLLCKRHHTLAHDTRYQLKAGPHGRVIFSRRT